MDKKIEDYLHLYAGQECLAEQKSDSNLPWYADERCKICALMIDWINEYNFIKPILLPMNSLTKEELRSQGFDNHIDYLTHEKQDPMNAPYKMVAYLISKGYDVFGLIESGLAISKVEVSNPLKTQDEK